MSADDFDDIPSLQPVPIARENDSDRDPRADYRDDRPRYNLGPPRKPGFGFWMAVVYTLLYFAVTQILAGIGFTILIFGIALVPEIRANGWGVLTDPSKLTEWMQGPTGRVATLCVVAATQFTGLALSWLLFRMTVGRSWKRKIALTRAPSGTQAILILIGVPALLAMGAAIDVPIGKYVPSLEELLKKIGIHFSLQGADEMLPDLIKKSPWVLALFVVGMSPAICEEVFCRGFLGQGLSGRYRAGTVVLIVSILFGLLHVDPRQGLGAMCLGAAIHGAYLATRSLGVAMFLHAANNGLAVIHYHPKLYPVLGLYERMLDDAPILFVASAAIFFGAIAYALYQTRCKLAPIDPDLPTWEPAGVSGVELPPPGSGTIMTHDPLSPVSVGLILIGSVAFGLVLALA